MAAETGLGAPAYQANLPGLIDEVKVQIPQSPKMQPISANLLGETAMRAT